MGSISPAKRIAPVLLLVTTLCNTFGADNKTGPTSIPELQTAIETVLKETKTPGAAIAIVSRDKEDWVAGVGKADVAANKPATAETLFRIGSTSKAFAALAALQLQEEGKLKLTDTVRQWVPEVAFANRWEASDPVRLVHLMEHTTGFDDLRLREYALNDPTPIALKDALAYGASSRISRWPPGARMAYCNSGPAILAAVIEKVSGQRFEDYVQEHFFNPLHMDTASYFYTPQVEQRLTKLYHSDGITPYPYWHISFRPPVPSMRPQRTWPTMCGFIFNGAAWTARNCSRPRPSSAWKPRNLCPRQNWAISPGTGFTITPPLKAPLCITGTTAG